MVDAPPIPGRPEGGAMCTRRGIIWRQTPDPNTRPGAGREGVGRFLGARKSIRPDRELTYDGIDYYRRVGDQIANRYDDHRGDGHPDVGYPVCLPDVSPPES